MENLYYNLSEQEFSRGRKILLWLFTSLFFLAGVGILFMNAIMHNDSIHLSLSLAPFGISLVSGTIAIIATFSKNDHYIIIDNDKIEFKFGMLKPSIQTFLWNDIKEIHLPHKQKKVKLIMKNDSSNIINLTWIEKKKSSHIRKQFYYAAREKNINIVKFQYLPSK
jgi:hypothetical protein